MKIQHLLLLFWGALFFIVGCGEDEPTNPPPSTTPPSLSVTNVTLFEGNDNTVFTFKVSISSSSTEEVKVNFATEEITAGDGTDYIGDSGTLTFSPGTTQIDVPIQIVTDTIRENDEQFEVILTNPVNATINTDRGLGTIRNDDTFVQTSDDGYETPLDYPGLDLVWNDEFNGTQLNTADWSYETGASGWGNNELQNYQDGTNNAFLSDGNLVIEAREENSGGANYTSARLITAGKQEFQFGRIDIRAKLPEGQGIWPALWMLGSNIWDIGWPACGEIDIMELVGNEPSTVHATTHWGPQGATSSMSTGNAYNLASGKFSDEFHVFSMVWEFNSVKLYTDDNLVLEIDQNTTGATPYPYNQPFFFIFNIAVGGNWPGNPDASTQFPQRMFVDYIRVFQ